MKKTLIIILTSSFISSQLASNEIYKTNNESVYLNLLSRLIFSEIMFLDPDKERIIKRIIKELKKSIRIFSRQQKWKI